MNENNRKELEILWTPQQVAKYLNMNQVTIYRWLMEGRVLDPTKIIRFSNRVRIPRSEVERIAGVFKKNLQEQMNAPASVPIPDSANVAAPSSEELETNKQ